jgi:hypothetical protein
MGGGAAFSKEKKSLAKCGKGHVANTNVYIPSIEMILSVPAAPSLF